MAEISGTIDFIGSSTLYLEKKPIHYKYSQKITYPIIPDNRGRFSKSIPLDSQQLIFFTIDNSKYPIVAGPGERLSLSIIKSAFPDSVEISGYPEPWNEYFAEYWLEEQRIQQNIDLQIKDFRKGDVNNMVELYKLRYKLAKRHLAETPLELYYYKNAGDYLVKRLEDITYRGKKGTVEAERNRVIEEAKSLNFFSLKSLKAQRAGILDFANAYAITFGIKDSLEAVYGQKLKQDEVKRLGFERWITARTSVLQHITQQDALAHAKMYLIADRIARLPNKVVEESYENYLKEFNEYPKYIQFLESLDHNMQEVSPGNSALPFTFFNQYGQAVQMKDFSNQYVLLDFWASGCPACVEEFSHMRNLYGSYSREQFEIISISIDNDSLSWRKSIDQFKNPWPQLYAGEGFEQQLLKDYQGSDLPFYVLIDPEGTIERYNDIRPSFNLPKVLDSLITK